MMSQRGLRPGDGLETEALVAAVLRQEFGRRFLGGFAIQLIPLRAVFCLFSLRPF